MKTEASKVVHDFLFFSSKQSETSRSARSTPVKKATRLVSYIDPDEEDDPDKTINEDEEDEPEEERPESKLEAAGESLTCFFSHLRFSFSLSHSTFSFFLFLFHLLNWAFRLTIYFHHLLILISDYKKSIDIWLWVPPDLDCPW